MMIQNLDKNALLSTNQETIEKIRLEREMQNLEEPIMLWWL
jgi:hypothetical protein